MQHTELVAVIPAAGASRRLGAPKQLLRYEGQTLIERCIETAAEVCDDVLVVTGANAAAVRDALPEDTATVHNEHWAAGLGTSLACAIEALPANCAAILVVLPDQPFVDADDLARLVRAWRANPETIACAAYAGTRGVPAVLPRRLFAQLAALDSESGAARLIEQDADTVSLPVPTAAVDIDTVDDAREQGLDPDS